MRRKEMPFSCKSAVSDTKKVDLGPVPGCNEADSPPKGAGVPKTEEEEHVKAENTLAM